MTDDPLAQFRTLQSFTAAFSKPPIVEPVDPEPEKEEEDAKTS